jgi:hypothetical protein
LPVEGGKIGRFCRSREPILHRPTQLLLWHNRPIAHFNVKPLITPGICAFLAALLLAAPATASTVDVNCVRLSAQARAELQARARLLLLGAGMESARIGVDCSRTASYLLWVDGSPTGIDETSGLVEGALDAIENRIARAMHPPMVKVAASPRQATVPIAAELPDGDSKGPFGTGARPDAPLPEAERAAPRPSSERELEGGVGLGTAVELSESVLAGPRLDVGVATGKGFAFVIGEGARFGFGSPDLGRVMVFDLQAGVAFGAPYQSRSSFGAVMLVGAERLAVAAGRFAEGGVWMWSGTLTLGVRGTVDLGPFDAWLGIEGLVRSATIQTEGPNGVSIPAVTALVSAGGFLPAFSRSSSSAPVSGSTGKGARSW